MKVKCKVTSEFSDMENDGKSRKVGEEFECTCKRAEFLQENKVVDIIEVTEKPTGEPKRKRTKKTVENVK